MFSFVMISLAQMFAGRNSLIWKYVEYNERTRKSVLRCWCKTGKECGTLLAGKNSSYLVSHIACIHKDIRAEYEALEKNRNTEKHVVKWQASDAAAGPSFEVQ